MSGQDPVQTPTQAAPAATAPKTPGGLISLAIQRFYEAQSVSGKIRLVQQARGTMIAIETDLAFDRPNKFLIRQRKTAGEPQQWLSVSDGNLFSYDKPPTIYGKDRQIEKVFQHGVSQTFDNMYPVAAKSIGDRSPILDLAFARRADLIELKAHWGTPRFTGKAQIRDREAHLIEGDYFEVPGEAATGSYQFAITDSGEVVRYSLKSRYGVPNQPGEVIEVLSTWDADLKLGGQNPNTVYTVRG
jgi:hypothetical protein